MGDRREEGRKGERQVEKGVNGGRKDIFFFYFHITIAFSYVYSLWFSFLSYFSSQSIFFQYIYFISYFYILTVNSHTFLLSFIFMVWFSFFSLLSSIFFRYMLHLIFSLLILLRFAVLAQW